MQYDIYAFQEPNVVEKTKTIFEIDVPKSLKISKNRQLHRIIFFVVQCNSPSNEDDREFPKCTTAQS